MQVSITALEGYAIGARWTETLDDLVDFEDLMGYPTGNVSLYFCGSMNYH